MIKKVIIVASILILSLTLYINSQKVGPTYYYVSSSGNDNNSGLSPKLPWKTLDKVNGWKFMPGDVVCFRKGDTWRGQLIPQSGDKQRDVKYTSYGSGKQKPAFLGSLSRSSKEQWHEVSSNIWTTETGKLEIGNIVFDYKTCGERVWRYDELKKTKQFYYDKKQLKLFLYSQKNPALLNSSIECCVKKNIIDQTFKSHVTYEGLSLKYGAAHGIWGYKTNNITVRGCDISYIGGADANFEGKHIRFGNGVEFWGEAFDCLVEKCNIWEVYDSAVTNQNAYQVNKQYNIKYRYNTIWNCEFSFEYFNYLNGSSTSDITFEYNNCYNAGGGWGHNQREDKAGRHISFYANEASISNICVSNNTFYSAKECLLMVGSRFMNKEALIFKNNKYYQSADKTYAVWGHEKYLAKDFKKFVSDKNNDLGSTLNTKY